MSRNGSVLASAEDKAQVWLQNELKNTPPPDMNGFASVLRTELGPDWPPFTPAAAPVDDPTVAVPACYPPGPNPEQQR